jgi:hypothetical protein
MTEELKWTELNPPERKRTYIFPTNDLEISDVLRICIRPSGSHRIETADGLKYIVNPGWLAIVLDTDDWTF